MFSKESLEFVYVLKEGEGGKNSPQRGSEQGAALTWQRRRGCMDGGQKEQI